MAEVAQNYAFSSELTFSSLNVFLRYFGAVLEDVVDLLDGALCPGYQALLHAAVGPGANPVTSKAYVLKLKLPQFGVSCEELHFACGVCEVQNVVSAVGNAPRRRKCVLGAGVTARGHSMFTIIILLTLGAHAQRGL